MPSSGASTRCPTPSAPKKSKTSAAGSAASCRRANLLYSRTRVPRPMRPLTLSLSPSGGEGIETTPSPSERERVGVRVALSSRRVHANSPNPFLRSLTDPGRVASGAAARPRSVTSGASEQAEGLVVEQAVGRQDGARVDVGPAGEVGEPAAGLLDEDLHRRRVPGLEVGLGVDLRLPRRYHAVAVVVAEAALARGRVHEALEPCPVPRGAQDVQARVNQERVLHRGARRDLDPFAIGPGALALARPEELARHRIVDHARRHLPVL